MSASGKSGSKRESPRGPARGAGKPPAPPPGGGPPRGRGFASGGGRRVDPYFAWAAATNFAYLPGDPSRGLPLFIKLAEITARQFATKDWGHMPVPGDLDDWLTIPAIYANPPRGLENSRFCTATIQPKAVAMLLKEPLLGIIESFELSDPVGFIEPPFDPKAELATSATTTATKPVIVATIDDGLPFANARFRKADGTTRIEFLWDQDRATDLSKPAIDNILNASLHGGLIDEDEAYRRAGYAFGASGHKSWARRVTHGAHVMDLACGLEPTKVAADSPRIIGVQFPSAVTADTSGARLPAHVFSALVYVLWHADRLAKKLGTGPLPIVVNLSYGLYHGPHDGTSLLEQAIDLVTQWRRSVNAFSVVLPAGNSYLARCHARFSLPAGASQTLAWRVQPDDATPSFIEIWLPAATGSKQVELSVTTPGGATSATLREGDGDPPSPFPATRPTCWLGYPVAPAGERKTVSLTLLSTSTLSPVADVAPSGTWRVTLKNVGETALDDIDAWIHRDDTAMGYPIRGRQSYFDDPAYEPLDAQGRVNEADNAASYVKRDGSINGIATGAETVVIGGWRLRDRKDRVAARYSAGSPAHPPRIPDATARSEDSDACHGLLATGTRTHSVAAVNGTSVAAPQATRLIARMMEAGYAGDRQTVKVEAAKVPTPAVNEKRGGAGALDAKLRAIAVGRFVPP